MEETVITILAIGLLVYISYLVAGWGERNDDLNGDK